MVMKKYVYFIPITVIALLLLLFETNPRSVSSAVLVIPFVLIFLVLFLSISYFLRVEGFTKKSSWAVAVFVAMLPTLLLVLQSIGQLTIRDVATIVALFLIAYFYVARVDGSVSK